MEDKMTTKSEAERMAYRITCQEPIDMHCGEYAAFLSGVRWTIEQAEKLAYPIGHQSFQKQVVDLADLKALLEPRE